MIRLLSFFPTICLSLLGILLLTVSCKQTEDSKIKQIANKYMKGRIELKSGDTLELKSITDPLLFRFLKLTQEYIKILNAPTISEDISRITAGEVKIDGQKATCKMMGHNFYFINLIRTKDSWKVNGENNEYITTEKVTTLRNKIARQIEYNKNKPAIYSVIKIVNLFFEGVKTYFKNGNIDQLEIIATPDTQNMIQKFYSYAKQRSGEDALLTESEKFNLVLGDVTFKSDSAEFKFFNESHTVNLIKQNNNFKVCGLEGLKSSEISQRIMADSYLNLLRALKLVREPKYRLSQIK